MKKRQFFKYGQALLLLLLVNIGVKAQGDNEPGPFMLSGMWQFSSNFNNHMASNISGWGSQIEMGYHVNPHFDAGAFISWHTNRTNFPRQVYYYDDYAVNMDMLYAVFQIPFGLFVNYSLAPNHLIEPYVGLKVGANYGEETHYHNVFSFEKASWGGYIAPEVGIIIYPFEMGRLCGFRVSLHYGFSNNGLQEASSGMRNWGIRFGIIGHI